MRRAPLALVALTLFFLAACGPKPINLTPSGQVAYAADQIAVRVLELQRTAIAAEASGGLSTETTRLIVTFCVSSAPILAATPQGWAVTVGAAWAQAKAQIPPITNPAVAAAFNLVDVMLAAYQPPKGTT